MTYAGESVWVDADLRIGQVVDNVLVNALTYTPAGGSVRVSGALDAASLPFVFDVFYQARQGRERAGEGLGVGLRRAYQTRV